MFSLVTVTIETNNYASPQDFDTCFLLGAIHYI
jgi:hypothetical protein